MTMTITHAPRIPTDALAPIPSLDEDRHQLLARLRTCLRNDQATYFHEPLRGTPEYRSMVANRRELEALRRALRPPLAR